MRTIAVIVVAYGAPEQLADALAPIRGHFPIVVVDNSSSRDVREVCSVAGATYLDPGSNLGFGAGVNVGLKHLGALQVADVDVLLLNPDAVVEPEVVLALQARLGGGGARVGVVAPSQRDPNDGHQQRVAWPFPSPERAWLEAVGLGRRLTAHPDFLIGSVLLLRAETIVAVGGFDERFFLYAEEADWQRRAAELGWRRLLCTDLEALHIGSGTSSNARRREVLFHAGQETYVRKWFGAVGWQRYRAAVVIGALARAILAGGPARAAARSRLSIYLAGPRRQAGLAPRG